VVQDGLGGLGHARLSIIDLATGDQPIASEDESLRIVANGEFYGFEKIREELESQGHVFRTRSDSEIALHLYEDAGARCRIATIPSMALDLDTGDDLREMATSLDFDRARAPATAKVLKTFLAESP